ncbi:MAG TPA: FAD-dependent oxidoreductase, partial [Polyangiaceae bacterium]
MVVVGGGITGAGILAEAARTGLKALLVEAKDFASGTSSRSTKLVHGGLRYLRQGQIRVTRESVVERERLMQEARGLVRPLGFWLTTFEGDRMPGWMFGLGLAMYDALAGKWEHERHDAGELVRRVPPLGGAKIRGAYHYFDGQTDDARLVVRVLREAVTRGGIALNYARATNVLRTTDGRVRGVVVEDASGGTSRSAEVQARVVINATGAWADDLRVKMGGERRLRPIRGSHLVLAGTRLPLEQAISMLHPRDGRAVFAIPWEGVTL